MRVRLAKKIACTPVNRLSAYWLDKALGGQDNRIEQALRIVERK